MDPLDAVRQVAEDLGLDASGAVVLRELGSAVVRLPRSGLVARVGDTADQDAVRREVDVCSYLAARGARVVQPHDQAGPHVVGERVVSLWQHVDHDEGRPLDAVAAGARLREVHELLAGFPVADLPHYVRLEECRAIVESLTLQDSEAADLAEMLTLAASAVETMEGSGAALQAVHGDAWLGNVLRTPDGPVWSDFEKVCRGPRELDLACNETAARQRGRTPDDDAFLAGYGGYDPDVLDHAARLELVPLTTWTYRLAQQRLEYAAAARERLGLALEGLRSRPTG